MNRYANIYMKWFVRIGWMVVIAALLLVAVLAVTGSPFDPPADFGCVPEMQATLANDAGTPIPGYQTWTLLKERSQQNSADEWRLKCKYGFSAIVGDPHPQPTPTP